MKALSIRQPWAWLIAHGHKDIENRDWPTRFRGPFLIHAGKTFDQQGYDYVRDEFPEIDMPKPSKFEKGGVVGFADITDCVKDSDSEWFFGDYGFVIANAQPLKLQPCRGQLGFFEIN